MGHMIRHRQWYQRKTTDAEKVWPLETAMLTIEEAASTKWGRATWLRTVAPGADAAVPGIACPVKRGRLAGKDWTAYGGHLFSDHSVRREFFRPGPEKPPADEHPEYTNDWTYLYHAESDGHLSFITGVPVTEAEVSERVGVRSSREQPSGERILGPLTAGPSERIDQLRDRTRGWRLTAEELKSLTGDDD